MPSPRTTHQNIVQFRGRIRIKVLPFSPTPEKSTETPDFRREGGFCGFCIPCSAHAAGTQRGPGGGACYTGRFKPIWPPHLVTRVDVGPSFKEKIDVLDVSLKRCLDQCRVPKPLRANHRRLLRLSAQAPRAIVFTTNESIVAGIGHRHAGAQELLLRIVITDPIKGPQFWWELTSFSSTSETKRPVAWHWANGFIIIAAKTTLVAPVGKPAPSCLLWPPRRCPFYRGRIFLQRKIPQNQAPNRQKTDRQFPLCCRFAIQSFRIRTCLQGNSVQSEPGMHVFAASLQAVFERACGEQWDMSKGME